MCVNIISRSFSWHEGWNEAWAQILVWKMIGPLRPPSLASSCSPSPNIRTMYREAAGQSSRASMCPPARAESRKQEKGPEPHPLSP